MTIEIVIFQFAMLVITRGYIPSRHHSPTAFETLTAEVLHTELPKTGDQQPVLKVPWVPDLAMEVKSPENTSIIIYHYL